MWYRAGYHQISLDLILLISIFLLNIIHYQSICNFWWAWFVRQQLVSQKKQLERNLLCMFCNFAIHKAAFNSQRPKCKIVFHIRGFLARTASFLKLVDTQPIHQFLTPCFFHKRSSGGQVMKGIEQSQRSHVRETSGVGGELMSAHEQPGWCFQVTMIGEQAAVAWGREAACRPAPSSRD